MKSIILTGVRNPNGTSSKTGKPYNFYLLNFIDPKPNDSYLFGYDVNEKVFCSAEVFEASGITPTELRIESVPVYVSYDRNGHLINIERKVD